MSSIQSISAGGPFRLVFVVDGRGSLNLQSDAGPGAQWAIPVACAKVGRNSLVNGSLIDQPTNTALKILR
jgi:hypothetical protein